MRTSAKVRPYFARVETIHAAMLSAVCRMYGNALKSRSRVLILRCRSFASLPVPSTAVRTSSMLNSRLASSKVSSIKVAVSAP